MKPMNILIVDDDRTNRKLLGAMLDAEGYETVEAGDGLEALEVLGKEKIDAVISDVLMPNMDGYRLCEKVRRRDRGDDMPFVFYTSTYTDSADEKVAMGFGADRFLRKPASAQVLSNTIREIVGNRERPLQKPAPSEELDVMKQYSEALIRKLERRNDQLTAQSAALHASETRLRTIFEAEPDCVQVIGRDGRVTEINPAGLEMFEVDSLAEAAARPLSKFVAEAHRSDFETCVEAVWRGESKCVEFEIIGARGRRRWLEMHAAPLRDQRGEIAALLGIARDNTARRELEAQFVQAQKMEVIGRLAGGVAHDFNNMLGIMMGYSEIALSELSSKTPLYEAVETIFHTAERAAALTRQLLIFSRKQKVQPQAIDLSEMITGIDPMLRRLISENIKLVTKPEMDLGYIEADPGQIEQVLMNLTVNARDAMPNGGTITISTSNATVAESGELAAGDYVVLTVADNGDGMTDEIKAKIFEAFFTTKPEGKGTGLGLATCQSIVSNWRGKMTVDSKPGAGATFKVYLPRTLNCAGPAAVSGGPRLLPRGGETILLVEDEPGLRELAATILQKQGYTILKAGNGQEALRVVRGRRGVRIDLVVTDVVMPQMGGRVMAEWLRATNPEITILFTSGYTDCGMDGPLDADIQFLQKPYTPSALVRKVREVIDVHAAGLPTNEDQSKNSMRAA